MTKVVVIGGGLSGLSAAYILEQEAQKAGLEIDVTVLEKKDRIGGKVWSIQEEGYTCEWGPNGFLDSKPWTLELCDNLGIRDQLVRSDDNARKRFIYSEGELHRMAENGPAFLKSKLISWPGKMRLAAELVIPKRTDGADETLADFGRRRLGSEALDKLIAPMVSGIFAGDPETMSLRSCFKRIYELEQEYGGLIKALIKLAKKKKREIKEGKVVASAAGPGGVLTSFYNGIQELTDGIAERIDGTIQKTAPVEKITKKDDGFELTLADGSTVDAEVVISATPSHAATGMVEGLDAELSKVLADIPYAPINVVCFGYERDRVAHNLDGFGYLIPKREGRSTLGTLWDSSIFPNRAPEGHVMLRSMMGGAVRPELVGIPEEEIVERVKLDLRTIMGVDADPSFLRVFPQLRAIPQYTVGHSKRVEAVEAASKRHPGLFYTGNAFYGVGLNDCVNASNQTVAKVINHLKK